MLVGIIIGAVVLLLIIFVISSYNKLVKQKVNVEEAFATMDVYLKKRFDLIPNLVETVKGYAELYEFEQSVGGSGRGYCQFQKIL